ncbi:hypothetical protein RclHR1_11380001 [Rhizophagus clarus]|uniref:Uncharacterized protein n=1 Tax=Rhizophagus clarus TaxID=94130 RepID=A0A2Z6Q3W6_9GLOM|nr:hypothetical protein RclHR1_11380001 [Rhizophagus clarus]GES72691.1 hypothetical protein RCL_jg15359.t1 [Rhizophagus clarus]
MSSNRKLRSNSSSSSATIKKQQNITKPVSTNAADLEFSITKNTYGIEEGPTAEEIVREILPQTKVKRQRQSSTTTTDEDMKETPSLPVNKVLSNTQTQPEPELLVINLTLDNNNQSLNIQYNKTGLNDSIHAITMNVDQESHDQNAALINNKENNNQVDLLTEISNEHEMTQTPHPTKGKNKELNENQSTSEIEIIDINTNDRNLSEEFKAFTLKKYSKTTQINKFTHALETNLQPTKITSS